MGSRVATPTRMDPTRGHKGAEARYVSPLTRDDDTTNTGSDDAVQPRTPTRQHEPRTIGGGASDGAGLNGPGDADGSQILRRTTTLDTARSRVSGLTHTGPGGTGTSGATMATRRAQADGPSPYTRHGQQGPLHIGITPYTFVITRIRDAPRVHLRLNATHSVLHTGCTRGASHHGVTHSATIRGHQRVHLRLNATHSVHTTSRASASTTSGVPAPLPNPPMPRGQGLHHARAPVRATPGVLGRLDKTVAMPLTSTYDSACLALYSTNVTDSC